MGQKAQGIECDKEDDRSKDAARECNARAECGKDTEVPFEPKTDRPVYCRDCFNAKRAARF